MPATKQYQLNLDPELYRQVTEQAKDSDMTIADWMRSAIKEKLGIDCAGNQLLTQAELKAELETICDQINGVQTSDKPNAEWWAQKLKDIAAMRPIDGWSALKHATKGIEIPKYLFQNRKDLAAWLAEHVK